MPTKTTLRVSPRTRRSATACLLAAALCNATIWTATPVFARSYGAVVVRGAQFIPEEDIRQTCGALPGVDYLPAELHTIEDCLMSTGVFESVALHPEGDVLAIEVSEIDQRPGHVSGALSYSPQDGVIGQFTFEQYNIFPGTYGRANLDYGREVRRYDLSFYHADALSPVLDLGLDITGSETSYDDRHYSDESHRIEPFLAWTPSSRTRLEIGLGWRAHRMSDVESTVSPLLQSEATGAISAPYLRYALSFGSADIGDDGRDDWARSGYLVRMDQYVWNLGTGDLISDVRLDAQAQMPLSDSFRLLLGVRAGTLHGLRGNDTRAIDRFFPGADTFRGFAPRGIGPRDGGEALGGNNYAVASIELQRDFGELMQMPVRGGLFMDAGSVWGLDDTRGGSIDDTWHMRGTLGLSVTFDVGRIPVSLYVARPIRDRIGDRTQSFGLSISATF